MADEIVMPRLSDSMEEGTILKWLVSEGDEIARGDPLAEIETDKANVTYESELAGTIAELVASEGDVLPVGAVIARVGAADEAPGGPAAPAREGGGEAERPDAGRATARGQVTVHEPTRTQRTVTRRMAESKATVPDYELRVEIDMTACIELRDRLKQVSDPPPSLNDMIVKACANALREHPRVNGAYRDGRFESYSRVNVGVAVAAADALLVPTIFDADRLSLGEVARESRELIERARSGAITPPELSGGTFTVSNLGMHGVDSFSAVVNPPQAALLTVGAVKRRPLVDDHGRIVVRSTMHAGLECDNRILYGAEAAAFLARVRELLEHTLALAL